MKQLISIDDLSKSDVDRIFAFTKKLYGVKKPLLKGKILAMIFEKPSTRTRVSFEVAMEHFGGHAIYLSRSDLQLSRGESIRDTARTLSRFVDVIMARVFTQETLVELARNATVPVINGLTHVEHPCQALTDMYTILQTKKYAHKLVFLGDGTNNTFASLIKVAQMFAMDIVVSAPKAYRPTIRGGFEVVENPKEAVKNADVLYTDTFVSMGEEKEMKKRLSDLSTYQLNTALVKLANDPIVMHPLPAHRGIEITDDVIDGRNSVVFEQAENRLHAQKAILYLLLTKQ